MENNVEKIAELAERNAALTEENAALKEELFQLKEQLSWLKKQVFGRTSEKTKTLTEDVNQISMFNETEKEAETTLKEETIEVASHRRKAKRTHEEIMKDLPVEEVVHKAEDRTCTECGSEMEVIGKEFKRDELVYVPAKLFVRKHYAEVLRCRKCSDNEDGDIVKPEVIRKASVPEAVIPHSYCSAELLAHIVFDKYIQATPLYRQEKEYAALNMKLSRTTMANWMIQGAAIYIKPVWELMKKDLLSSKVINADETVVQVLHEDGRQPKNQSRMWVYCSPHGENNSNILYEYAPTRSGENAVRFLGDYSGYLVCDGYDGYNRLTKAKRCGCMAHLRRKFTEALPADKALIPGSKSAEGLEYCNRLFELEREYEDMSSDKRYKERQEKSKPVLDEFFLWLDTFSPSGGTAFSKAVQYAKNEKRYLYRFLEDGDIPISNNRAENAIRPFVVGRKNWLFSDSVKGAEASAMIYSVAVTAQTNGLDVEKYFKELFSSKNPIMPCKDK